MKSAKKWCLVSAGSLITIATVVIILDRVLPYSSRHLKTLEAGALAHAIVRWEQFDGAKDERLHVVTYTSAVSRIWIYRTNIAVGGDVYESVLALDSMHFRGKGFLIGTRNKEIIWVGYDGVVSLVPKEHFDTRR